MQIVLGEDFPHSLQKKKLMARGRALEDQMVGSTMGQNHTGCSKHKGTRKRQKNQATKAGNHPPRHDPSNTEKKKKM